jgi:antitoxin MazE
MKLTLILIGNSQGIRIPKALLKQCGFKDKVIAKVENGKLILSAAPNPRHGWEEAFKKMAQCSDDTLLDKDYIESSFDRDEWEW